MNAVIDGLTDQTHILRQIRCSPYHQNGAWHPVTDYLERWIGYHQEESPEEKLIKLEKALEGFRFPLTESVPLLAPILGVVFVTLTINALKMFDLIVGIAPGSVQDEANVIALEMWRTAFTGLGNRGLGAAIAVFLFVLILPVLALNLRRFKMEEAA